MQKVKRIGFEKKNDGAQLFLKEMASEMVKHIRLGLLARLATRALDERTSVDSIVDDAIEAYLRTPIHRNRRAACRENGASHAPGPRSRKILQVF